METPFHPTFIKSIFLQKSISFSARVPKLGAFYFPEEHTTGIAPLTCVVDGNPVEGEKLTCLWDDKEVNAVLVKVSGNGLS